MSRWSNRRELIPFTSQENRANLMDEISVLDYIRLKMKPENWHRAILPENDPIAGRTAAASLSPSAKHRGFMGRMSDYFQEVTMLGEGEPAAFPIWVLLLIILCSLIAQALIDPQTHPGMRKPWVSLVLYGIGLFAILIAAFVSFRKRSKKIGLFTKLNRDKTAECDQPFELNFQQTFFMVSLTAAAVAFFLFGSNRFNFINVLFWLVSILFAFFSFSKLRTMHEIRRGAHEGTLRLRRTIGGISAFQVLWLAVFCLSIFYRFHLLHTVPTDMFSDHAEKLLDVQDVLRGKTSIFFTRNTGREAFQFYWTVMLLKLFGTGISFLSLKIGTALAGVLTLPFVYLIGKKLFNREVGLIAMGLCGVAYWPNVIDRVALRFAFYPMFAAPAFYYLLSGLVDRKTNRLILSGLFLGFGLQGYSAMRIVPAAFFLFFLMYLATIHSSRRANAVSGFAVLVYFAILAALPLLRILTVMPVNVLYRSLTRISGMETAIETGPLQTLLDNAAKSLIMPFWDNGRIWVHSVPFRPALDFISAAFLAVGLIFFLIRIVRLRRWQDIVLLLSVPLFMLPSILSIAFPDENPSLNRTGAAMIPIFCIAAYGIWVTLRMMLDRLNHSRSAVVMAGILFLALLGTSARLNYRLVFEDYQKNYRQNALNTREMGEVIKGYAASIGDISTAFVVPFPHWADTRLVAISAGFPERDTALDKSQITSLSAGARPLLFLYKSNDSETAQILNATFPDGLEKLHTNPVPGRDFYTYLVPQ